jgi:hypothetical protein
MIRHYHTILSKPVDLFSSNVLVYCSIESLRYVSLHTGWPLGILMISISLRLGSIPISYYLDSINWKLPKFLNPVGSSLYQNIILNDLESQVKKKSMTESQHEELKQKIQPSVLVRQAIQSYLLLGYTRGLHQISFNPQYYEGMQDTYLGAWSLCSADPFCLIPLVSGLTTYYILKTSSHPFTLNLTPTHWFWIGFCASLGSIPLPICYSLAYTSFGLSHIGLKLLNPRMKKLLHNKRL